MQNRLNLKRTKLLLKLFEIKSKMKTVVWKTIIQLPNLQNMCLEASKTNEMKLYAPHH